MVPGKTILRDWKSWVPVKSADMVEILTSKLDVTVNWGIQMVNHNLIDCPSLQSERDSLRDALSDREIAIHRTAAQNCGRIDDPDRSLRFQAIVPTTLTWKKATKKHDTLRRV